jgi:hypothetical protein
MTALDRDQRHSGYWDSPWPVECGGNRRQKAATGRLDASAGTATVTTRRDDKWHVMVVRRDPDQWYLGGTMPAFSGPPPYGWVERIDPETLEVVAASPELPCGDHVWCGSILAHANGSVMSVNGSYVHRLDPGDLSIVAECRLPADRAHNGMLALSDGTLVTKDLRLEGQGHTTITRLDPDTLELVGEPLALPEGSMGRIAADIDDDGSERVYVPGTEHVFHLESTADRLVLGDWRPRYRETGGHTGLAWDSCIAAGDVWLMDCGDIEPVRRIHTTVPNGRFDRPPGSAMSWRQPAPWSGALRLVRISLDDPGDVEWIEPFGTPGGGIIAPPVVVPELQRAIAWDSVNGGLAGIATSGNRLEVAWQLAARPTMQPVVFPDSGELVINDFTDHGSDDLIVVDISDGTLLDRVATGSPIANGMFLSPGGGRDVFYCSTTAVAHIAWS